MEHGGRLIHLPRPIAKALWEDPDTFLAGELGDSLERIGLLERPEKSAPEVDRNRVFAAAMCGARGDEALRAVREHEYVIAGCGGLGSNAAVELAALGARHLTLIDGDVIEHSNLNRLLWACESDVTRLKVDALAEHLEGRFGASVRTVPRRVSSRSLEEASMALPNGSSTWLVTVDDGGSAREAVTWLHGREGVRYVHSGYVGAFCTAGPLVSRKADACPFCGSGQYRVTTDSFVAPSAAPNNLLLASFLAAQLLLVAGDEAGPLSLQGVRWTMDLRSGVGQRQPLSKAGHCDVCR